jgi:chaperonin GroEL
MSDKIVKNLSFGDDARNKVFNGIDKLANAVSSTLGAGGSCVLLEDQYGNPTITKDGVTVAESVVLIDPVENLGCNLLKQAAKKTVKEAGDGTTTATVLAHSILYEANKVKSELSVRELKKDINKSVNRVVDYLNKISIPVKDEMIEQIATISTNNDKELGKLIGKAFENVKNTGVVIMEQSDSGKTEIETIEGSQYFKGLTSPHFVTNKIKKTAELNNPLVLLVENNVENIRQIQSVLEYVIKNNKSLLIIADLSPEVLSALAMNKTKGNIKVNVIDAPVLGVNRKQIFDDLALLTGATLINEDLGDDMDLIEIDHLGTCFKSITSQTDTILQFKEQSPECAEIIKDIEKKLITCKIPEQVISLEKRLAMLSSRISVVKVGANSEIELKEKMDRVEDAICATKAAVKEGIVPGGGIALLNASQKVKAYSLGERLLLSAITAPYRTILSNAGVDNLDYPYKKGQGYNVVTGKMVNMIKSGIIDPLLVTKSALKNAASVATTILSTNCVINNVRINESNR